MLSLAFTQIFTNTGDKLELNIEQGEYWWGGLSSKGHETPYDATTVVTYDLWGITKVIRPSHCYCQIKEGIFGVKSP